MTNFLNFINKDSENAYIKSAIAQLWLAIIHLYGDGNSRLARALEHFWLSVSGIKIYYSISSVIYSNKKGYYEILEQTTKLNNNLNFDFMPWVR